MLSTIRPLTKQKTYMHYQHHYLNNSILTAGTLATRFSDIYFPGRGIVRSFGLLSKFLAETTTQSFRVPSDNKSVPTDNEIKFENESFQNKNDTNMNFDLNNPNKN